MESMYQTHTSLHCMRRGVPFIRKQSNPCPWYSTSRFMPELQSHIYLTTLQYTSQPPEGTRYKEIRAFKATGKQSWVLILVGTPSLVLPFLLRPRQRRGDGACCTTQHLTVSQMLPCLGRKGEDTLVRLGFYMSNQKLINSAKLLGAAGILCARPNSLARPESLRRHRGQCEEREVS